jgi:type IV pilus assembly protein PilQ
MIRGLDRLIKVFLIFGFFLFFNLPLRQPGLGRVYSQNFTEALSEGQIESLRFKDANIKTVIRSIAQKAYRDGKKVNIVISPAVQGAVTVDLADIDWLTALEVVIRPYDYGYEWVGKNTVVVDSTEKITEREKRDLARREVERPRTKVFNLKYIDANDAKKSIEPLLSSVGRATVLEVTGQAGWEFGIDVTKRQRTQEKREARTKVMVVSDIAKKIDEIGELIAQIDIKPKQILIKTRIMEVSEDLLNDFGFQWFTGSDPGTEIDIGSGTGTGSINPFEQTPSVFNPSTSSLTPASGLEFAFKKITGTDLEAVLHAVKDDAYTNTLSAPTILTLNNQEASILVGEKYPIVTTEVSTETNRVTGGSLDYYQDIGVQLNVVPQISGQSEDYINMIIHPAVTSLGTNVNISTAEDQNIASYPRINTREAETQVLMKDGETIVIGGLLKDVKSNEEIGVPFLSKIPILGWLFKRQTKDTEKIDLLIFITAHVLEPGKVNSIELIESRNVTGKFEKKESKK